MNPTIITIQCRSKLATVMDCIEHDTARSVADLHDLKALLDAAADCARKLNSIELMDAVCGMRKLFASYCRVWARERMAG